MIKFFRNLFSKPKQQKLVETESLKELEAKNNITLEEELKGSVERVFVYSKTAEVDTITVTKSSELVEPGLTTTTTLDPALTEIIDNINSEDKPKKKRKSSKKSKKSE